MSYTSYKDATLTKCDMPSIYYFSLSWNRISADGATGLGEMLKVNQALETLKYDLLVL